MMEMFFKKEKIKSIGMALAGLGLVFFGLDIMSGSMKVYTEIQEVQDLLSTLKNPFVLLLLNCHNYIETSFFSLYLNKN